MEPIRNEEEYAAAMLEIEPYFAIDPELGTPEGDRLDALAARIEEYEASHCVV